MLLTRQQELELDALSDKFDADINAVYTRFYNGGYDENVKQFEIDVRQICTTHMAKRRQIRDRYRQAG